jgi:hypothetical protein
MSHEKILQATVTGEAVQPIRLYYQLADKGRVISRFGQLRCMDFDQGANRWVWLYAYEARNLKFRKPYSLIPKQMHPIVIGSFFFKDSEAFLDLRSFDRAIKAIPFFHKYVGPEGARITYAAVVNRLFDAREQFPASLDVFFSSGKMTERNPDESVAQIESLIRENRAGGKSDWFCLLEQRAKEPVPEIEKLPVNFYEDGISSFEAALRVRQIVAFEHWKGNTDYTWYDVFKTMIPGS